jgi:transcriptional regulator with XRE-family HTH domain
VKRIRIYASPEDYFRKTGDTQAQLAAKVGISQAHLSMILSGKRTGTVGLLLRLADTMGVPIESLVGRRRNLTNRNTLGRTA